MFTKQHFKAIAEIIRKCGGNKSEDKILEIARCSIISLFAKSLADYFIEDNPRFDREKFLKACGL